MVLRISEIDQNIPGDEDPNLIQFTGAGFGLSHDNRLGIVMNKAKFGEYFDNNENPIHRENCGERPDLGRFLPYIYNFL